MQTGPGTLARADCAGAGLRVGPPWCPRSLHPRAVASRSFVTRVCIRPRSLRPASQPIHGGGYPRRWRTRPAACFAAESQRPAARGARSAACGGLLFAGLSERRRPFEPSRRVVNRVGVPGRRAQRGPTVLETVACGYTHNHQPPKRA